MTPMETMSIRKWTLLRLSIRRMNSPEAFDKYQDDCKREIFDPDFSHLCVVFNPTTCVFNITLEGSLMVLRRELLRVHSANVIDVKSKQQSMLVPAPNGELAEGGGENERRVGDREKG